jgi:hypothetical protein
LPWYTPPPRTQENGSRRGAAVLMLPRTSYRRA